MAEAAVRRYGAPTQMLTLPAVFRGRRASPEQGSWRQARISRWVFESPATAADWIFTSRRSNAIGNWVGGMSSRLFQEGAREPRIVLHKFSPGGGLCDTGNDDRLCGHRRAKQVAGACR